MSLTEDEIDDVVYLARYNELDDLRALVGELAAKHGRPAGEIVAAAVDPYSKSTPLHMACANGHVEAVRYLVETLASAAEPAAAVNARNESGNTPLHWACLNGLQPIVEILCDAGADPLAKNEAGQDCIYQAEINNKMDLVDWLLVRFESKDEGDVTLSAGTAVPKAAAAEAVAGAAAEPAAPAAPAAEAEPVRAQLDSLDLAA
ncbi:ankyrin repeat-containing domain protein [Dipodascopsis tothii]|uniref:ankyrin repeat-containing domain protein n=1 Tax=Dipodascopsis tothii TaxID=44089 RepID=UPI0034CF22D3